MCFKEIHCCNVMNRANLKRILFGIEFTSLTRDMHLKEIVQWFPTLSWRTPSTAYCGCFPNQTHPILHISSLVKTPRPQMGVPKKRKIKNVQCWVTPGSGLETTEIVNLKMKISTLLHLICLTMNMLLFVHTGKTCSDPGLSSCKMYHYSSPFNLAHILSIFVV